MTKHALKRKKNDEKDFDQLSQNPDEILLHIFSFLEKISLQTLACVSKRLASISQDTKLPLNENNILNTARDIFRNSLKAYLLEKKSSKNICFFKRIWFSINHHSLSYKELNNIDEFLKEMDNTRQIKTLKALFFLTQKEKYQTGTELPNILKNCVVLAAGFNLDHINLYAKINAGVYEIKYSSEQIITYIRRLVSHDINAKIKEQNFLRYARDDIYQHIISSNDMGRVYLYRLQRMIHDHYSNTGSNQLMHLQHNC